MVLAIWAGWRERRAWIGRPSIPTRARPFHSRSALVNAGKARATFPAGDGLRRASRCAAANAGKTAPARYSRAMPRGDAYDLILVGTGFASAFFLHRFLSRAKPGVRVLVLERGVLHEHAVHLKQRESITAASVKQVANRTPEKPWAFQLTFGGGSNCWFGTTPRMSAEDFRLLSKYGQGRDWPITYDDLERFYCDAEEMIAVSGDGTEGPHERSRPYPLPPHRFSRADELLKEIGRASCRERV